MICQCCNNYVSSSYGVTMNWLIGKSYVWIVCYKCWDKPFLKALFLNSKEDLPEQLLKKFGRALGYTNNSNRLNKIKTG